MARAKDGGSCGGRVIGCSQGDRVAGLVDDDMQAVTLVNEDNYDEILRISQQLGPLMGDFRAMSELINCVLPYMPTALVDSNLAWWTLSIAAFLSQYIGGRYVRSLTCRTAWANRHLVESEEQERLLAECLVAEDPKYLPVLAESLYHKGRAGYIAACRLAYYAHQHGSSHYLRRAIKRLSVFDDSMAISAGNPIAEYHLAVARYELLTRGQFDLDQCVGMIAGLSSSDRQIYAIELCSFAPITSREIGIIMADNDQLVGNPILKK
jgi:hypothetical protein